MICLQHHTQQFWSFFVNTSNCEILILIFNNKLNNLNMLDKIKWSWYLERRTIFEMASKWGLTFTRNSLATQQQNHQFESPAQNILFCLHLLLWPPYLCKFSSHYQGNIQIFIDKSLYYSQLSSQSTPKFIHYDNYQLNHGLH